MFAQGCIGRWVCFFVQGFGISQRDCAVYLTKGMVNECFESMVSCVRLIDRKLRFPLIFKTAIQGRLHPIMQLRLFSLDGCMIKKRISLSSRYRIGQEGCNRAVCDEVKRVSFRIPSVWSSNRVT